MSEISSHEGKDKTITEFISRILTNASEEGGGPQGPWSTSVLGLLGSTPTLPRLLKTKPFPLSSSCPGFNDVSVPRGRTPGAVVPSRVASTVPAHLLSSACLWLTRRRSVLITSRVRSRQGRPAPPRNPAASRDAAVATGPVYSSPSLLQNPS